MTGNWFYTVDFRYSALDMFLWKKRNISKSRAKIFCIGFHKTGTTSLRDALRHLGYRVTGPNGNKDPDIATTVLSMVDTVVPEFDAFQDNPWPILYEYLDQKYPGSKFILTMRDEAEWIRSQVHHFGTRETPMRQWIYGVGCPVGNESVYLERYREHYQDVLSYFEGRSDDLLKLDLSAGHGWPELCEFLDVRVPDIPFPHSNRKVDRLQDG